MTLKIQKTNNDRDTPIQSLARDLIESKIQLLLKTGLPNRWEELLTNPAISSAELESEHLKIRSQCGRSFLLDDDPSKCPTVNDCQVCAEFDPETYSIGWLLAERGDVLLYPKEPDRDAFNAMFEQLTDAIALLSFLPGGVPSFWNYSYEAVSYEDF